MVSGTAVVAKLPVSALTSATAPTQAAVTWEKQFAPFLTSKAARGLPDGSVVALLYAEASSKQASLVLLDGDGAVSWGPKDYGSQHGEGTDIVVAYDGGSFAISGQGPGGVEGSLSGRLTKVSIDGVYIGSASYSSVDYAAGGSSKLIKNECWGLQALRDGYIVGCGTGIEDCIGYTGQKLTDCNSGLGDKTTGAVARPPSVWQSLIIRTDLDGGLLWQRVDQYREQGQPALGEPGWQAQSSASEYVIVLPSGGFVSVNDEVNGIGLLRLGAESGGSVVLGNSASKKDDSGAIIGGVVGGVVAVALCVLAFFAYRKWQMSKKVPATTTATDSKFDSVSGDRA